jgi:hypothetical protein
MEAETSSTSKSGVQTGKYSWRGGKPQDPRARGARGRRAHQARRGGVS